MLTGWGDNLCLNSDNIFLWLQICPLGRATTHCRGQAKAGSCRTSAKSLRKLFKNLPRLRRERSANKRSQFQVMRWFKGWKFDGHDKFTHLNETNNWKRFNQCLSENRSRTCWGTNYILVTAYSDKHYFWTLQLNFAMIKLALCTCIIAVLTFYLTLQELLGYLDKDPTLICRECFSKPCTLKCKDHLVFALFSAKEIALLINLDGKPYPIKRDNDEENNLISIRAALWRLHGGLGRGYK